MFYLLLPCSLYLLTGEKKIKVTNLIQAPPCLRIREINNGWVNKLTEKILFSKLQNSILPVMQAPQYTEDSSEEGDSEYWLLGGNHLVAAMKTVDPQQEVLCHVYDELTTEEAIRVATNHNRKHAVFPITFQDRVAIARKIRVDEGEVSLATRLKEVLGEIEHKEFKDSVSTIVSVARYSDGNYKLFQQIASEASDEQKSLNQKLFKILQSEGQATREAALTTAIQEGTTHSCQWVTAEKNRAALQRIFCREVGAQTWEEAERKHPNRTKELMGFQGLIDGQKKYVPEKILTFCKESLHTDHTDDVSVTVTVERNGRTIKLNDRMTRMIQKLSQKIKEEVHKDNKMEE